MYSGNLPEELKVRSTFKVKSLARPKLDVPKKKIICEIFHKGTWEEIKLKGTTAFRANALILREWKKGKANGKEIKKYIDIYWMENRVNFAERSRRSYLWSRDYQIRYSPIEKTEETTKILYQEGAKKSRKVMKGWLNTTAEPSRWRMIQRKSKILNQKMITMFLWWATCCRMKKRWQNSAMKKTQTQLKKTPQFLGFSETDFEDTEGLDSDQDILRDMNIFRKNIQRGTI